MGILEDIFNMLGTVIKEIFSGFGKFLPKAISFLFWLLAGILILPCVYVSAQIYPLWQKWGEKL